MNSQLIDDLEKLHGSLVDIETSNDVLPKLDALGKFVEEGNYQQMSIASNASAQLSQRRAQEVCEHCRYYYVEGYGSKRTHHCSQGFSAFANSNCPAFTKKQV